MIVFSQLTQDFSAFFNHSLSSQLDVIPVPSPYWKNGNNGCIIQPCCCLIHSLKITKCIQSSLITQSQVAAPTCTSQLTDGSAQSNCSSRRSATLPITFFLIGKIWKGDLRARFCEQLWILMNELCRFSQNKHPTSPALRLEAGTSCLQSQPTWDLCGPPKTTFLKTPSSCGP